MACQKLSKQGRDDAKVNVLAKPHPYIFFTLQLDSIGVLLKHTTSLQTFEGSENQTRQ